MIDRLPDELWTEVHDIVKETGSKKIPKKKKGKKHEKMLNITHYQRNANQNHNEVPLHASQDGCYPKVYKQ